MEGGVVVVSVGAGVIRGVRDVGVGLIDEAKGDVSPLR